MDRELYNQVLDYDKSEIPENRRPASGYVWVCGACGKIAADKYGIIGPHSRMYDESCMLNSVEAKLTDSGWEGKP
jgi:hypothetical protein